MASSCESSASTRPWKAAARHRVERDLDRLARLELRQVALGQAEVDPDLGRVFDVDDVGTVLDVVADVHTADTGHTVERRQDLHALELRLGQRHLGHRHLERGGALVDHALADEVLRHQFAVALQVGAGNAGLRLGLAQLRHLQGVVELDQHLATPHALAVGEAEPRRCGR